MKPKQLTIFYDGQCPLCQLEMEKLKTHDKNNAICLVDLHQNDFTHAYPSINPKQAMKVLHGQYQGKLLLGLAVTHQAWTLVGKGALVAPLQFPVIKQIANGAYWVFARYRLPLSRLIAKYFGIGLNTCKKGSCDEKPSNTYHRR